MTERNILIIKNRENVAISLPKNNFSLLLEFFSEKFNSVSDFFHKWMKP
jgi:hypothetical protein